MQKKFLLLSISIALFSIELVSQSTTVELGISKHFMPNTAMYDGPNLHLQIEQRVFSKIDLLLNYYSIKTYWPIEEHEIVPWKGDDPELYSRIIKGIELSINLVPLFIQESNLGFAIGPTARKRDEDGFYLCQYTLDGWLECFGYADQYFDFGLTIEANYNYFIWHNLGFGFGMIERFYSSGPPSFSLNFGVLYKFNY